MKQETKPRLKRRAKQEAPETRLEIADVFSVASAKENDFELDLDAAKFQGKKGQAGTRTKSVT